MLSPEEVLGTCKVVPSLGTPPWGCKDFPRGSLGSSLHPLGGSEDLMNFCENTRFTFHANSAMEITILKTYQKRVFNF